MDATPCILFDGYLRSKLYAVTSHSLRKESKIEHTFKGTFDIGIKGTTEFEEEGHFDFARIR